MAIRRPLILNAGKVGEIPTGDTFPADVIPSAPRVALPDQVQNAHGFVPGDVIRFSGGAWVKANASSRAGALAIAVVESATTNTFLPVLAGRIVLSGLTAGSEYYLSDVTPGLLTTESPEYGSDSFQVPILRAASSTVAYVEIGFPLPMQLVPSDALAGLSNNPAEAAAPDKFLSTSALNEKLTALLDGLTISFDGLSGISTGRLIGRASSGTGFSEDIVIGTGLTLSLVGGVPTLAATAGGTNTPVALSGTSIDWTAGLNRTKVLTANDAYTFENVINGSSVSLLLTASGADRTPTWPGNVVWGDAGAPTIVMGETIEVRLKPWGSFVLASIIGEPWTIDLVKPTPVSATINTAGNRLVLVFSEAVNTPTTGDLGFSAAFTGGAVTFLYHSGTGTNTITLETSRTINSTDTNTGLTYAPGSIADLVGNVLDAFSGATIENDSEASTYIVSLDFESGSQPSIAFHVAGSGTTTWNAASIVPGATYGVESDGSWYVDLGADYNEVHVFFYMKPALLATGSCVEFRNSSGVSQGGFDLRTDRVQRKHGTNIDGGATVSMTGASNVGTYWVQYKAESTPGMGSPDGRLEIFCNWNSTSELRPSTPKTSNVTTGNGDAVRRVYFLTPGGDGTHKNSVGKFRAATAAIGSNPV